MNVLEKYFNPAAKGSSVKRECLAGLTSFMAMSYLIFVVPAMLVDAGMPKDSAVAATLWVTILATLLMGLWAKFPVGVAPGLGITAFFAYYVCGPAGYTWQTGLGAVFISGVVFLVLTATHLRQMIINAVPMDLKYAIVVGIGAFIAFIGMKNCGMVAADASTFVTLGNLAAPETLLAVAGIFLISALMVLRVPGAMIIGILAITLLGMLTGVSSAPQGALFSGVLPLPTETFLQMDIKGALHHGLISIIFTLTMVDLFDNMGVLIGLSQKAGFMREDGISTIWIAPWSRIPWLPWQRRVGSHHGHKLPGKRRGRSRRRPHGPDGRGDCRALFSGAVLRAAGGAGALLCHGAGADYRGRHDDAGGGAHPFRGLYRSSARLSDHREHAADLQHRNGLRLRLCELGGHQAAHWPLQGCECDYGRYCALFRGQFQFAPALTQRASETRASALHGARGRCPCPAGGMTRAPHGDTGHATRPAASYAG